MKEQLKTLISAALVQLQTQGMLPEGVSVDIQLERCRDSKHGDFACNVALVLAKQATCAPRQLAEALVNAIPRAQGLEKIEIAGPGFINFFLSQAATQAVIARVLQEKEQFGCHDTYAGKRAYLEYVSSNPTGPLHVGHGRGAAYGATLANILAANGYQVHREYYVNDAGRQMDMLTVSLWLRYLQQLGLDIPFPEKAYQGEYLKALAANLSDESQNRFCIDEATRLSLLALMDSDSSEEAEKRMDALIAMAKTTLNENYLFLHRWITDAMLANIREDLAYFGVAFENWFSEASLFADKKIAEVTQTLKDKDKLYEKDGALWLRSTDYGDEKDRVFIRDNGAPTYLAPDVAYHLQKFTSGADVIIDVFGADHHGYVPRMRAAMEALGQDITRYQVSLVQFAILYRGKEKVAMSTRSGEFVTLRQLCDEVGVDAARFFYVMRKADQHMDFDLALAKSKSIDNPVYYVQYAHARICRVFEQLEAKFWHFDASEGLAQLNLLVEPQEHALITRLWRFPDVLSTAAKNYEPHLICHYLRDLAQDFHAYYNAHAFIIEQESLRNARLCLVQAVRQTIKNGLTLLNVSAPEKM